MTLRARLQEPQHRLLTYTFVPPPQGATRHELDVIADTLQRLLASAPIDAIHVPEVRPDPRSPRRRFVPKLAPRAFARAMDQRLMQPPDWLIDRSVADHHWSHQESWLRRTVHEQGYRSLMLVGGASRTVRNPGPSVADAARRIRAVYGGDVCLGGVVIPTRRDELERLIAKTEAGVDLFITQILGETGSTTRLLMDYHRACRERGWRPRSIALSVAPVANRRDLEFLEAWGVRFDPQWRRHILSGPAGIGWRSIDLTLELIEQLMAFGEHEAPNIPLGVNIEHVRARNVELSAELLQRLVQRRS